MSAHEAHPAWRFHILPFFFVGLGGPPGTWGGGATRGGDAMRGWNIISIHSSRCYACVFALSGVHYNNYGN